MVKNVDKLTVEDLLWSFQAYKQLINLRIHCTPEQDVKVQLTINDRTQRVNRDDRGRGRSGRRDSGCGRRRGQNEAVVGDTDESNSNRWARGRGNYHNQYRYDKSQIQYYYCNKYQRYQAKYRRKQAHEQKNINANFVDNKNENFKSMNENNARRLFVCNVVETLKK